MGIHLLAVAAPPSYDEASLSDEERAHLDQVAAWTSAEGGYQHQQSTRPLTLAHALSDSPAGLLAWLLEKYRTAVVGDGLPAAFDDDFVLTQASLYWFTNTIATSFRPYYEYAQGITPRVDRVDVPTVFAGVRPASEGSNGQVGSTMTTWPGTPPRPSRRSSTPLVTSSPSTARTARRWIGSRRRPA